jgi:sugar phosphate isomerase/epimerase
MYENMMFLLEIYKSSHSTEQVLEIFKKYVVEIVPFGGRFNLPSCDYYKIFAHYTERSTIIQLFEDNNIGRNRYCMEFVVEEDKELPQYDLLIDMSKDINSFMDKLLIYKKIYNKTYNEEFNNIDLIEAKKLNFSKMELNGVLNSLIFYQKNIDNEEKNLKEELEELDKHPDVILTLHDHRFFANPSNIKAKLTVEYRKRKLLFDSFYNFFISPTFIKDNFVKDKINVFV